MKKIIARHKFFWKTREFRRAVFSGVIFLAISLIVNHFANLYANMRAGKYVSDIILDNLPVMDVDDILNYGVEFFFLFVMYFLVIEPRRVSFVFKSLALFLLIRSAFIILTHLGPSPIITPINPNDLLSDLITGNDFFFSGHTGAPFLIALIFWEDKFIRYVSIAMSIIFGAAVLLGHLHYSIDVFAAFFITYSIYHIAIKFFPKDYKLLEE